MSEPANAVLDLNGRMLQLLVAVVEEGAITRAAKRLDVTQSAVSHMLDRLRVILDDPLFVKSGRGIVATERAVALAAEARLLLEELHRFAQAERFEPTRLQATFTIAANDLQRELLLPQLFRRLQTKAPGLSLRVIPSGVPTPEMLRSEHCQLVISPRPPDIGDVVQKRLFEGGYRVYYDASRRDAPRDLPEYLAADHITVTYYPPRSLDVDQVLASRGVERRFAIRVPSFSGIASFLRGSRMLATLPDLLSTNLLQGFASCPVPVECPTVSMYMIWHLRHRHDPVHAWVRKELEAVMPGVLARIRESGG